MAVNASEKIDAKIAELTDWRGEILARLRELIRQADPGRGVEVEHGLLVARRAGLLFRVFQDARQAELPAFLSWPPPPRWDLLPSCGL